VIRASDKGFDITSPEKLKRIISQQKALKNKESKESGVAKGSWLWSKTGPSSYII
jgi:hypothetical protein